MKVNIIADIAGRYNELLKLLEVMPKADKIVLVGDLVDRGPDSKKVVQWAMKGIHNDTPIITLYGNHEDIFVGGYVDQMYPMEYAENNGYFPTMKSYGVNSPGDYPESHVNWMINLPLFHREEGLFISHAPWLGNRLPETNEDLEKFGKWRHSIVWNRRPPKKVEGVFQVYGHNHLMEKHDDWGICLDDCANKKLTGFHWPDKSIFQVEYENV
jgi:serine/threonine protein phosphatase 1